MSTPDDLEKRFWKALKSDRTVMLGLDGVEGGHARPMTVLFENDRSPLWIFTVRDTGIVEHLSAGNRAIATFTSRGHDLYATIHGSLSIDDDRAVIDRLWNPFVAAWYPGGKDDPQLVLLRLDAGNAEIWLDGSSLVAGVKRLFGADPKKDARDKVAAVSLR